MALRVKQIIHLRNNSFSHFVMYSYSCSRNASDVEVDQCNMVPTRLFYCINISSSSSSLYLLVCVNVHMCWYAEMFTCVCLLKCSHTLA